MNIPLHRRVETAVTLVFLALQTFCILGSFVLLFLFPLPMILYLGFIFVYDKATPSGQGRRLEWFRELKFFKYLKDYFPCATHKTADLDPSKTYIFVYHPHGILSVGCFITFGTNATGFKELFPGITSSLCTLPAQFFTPFWREILLYLGVRDSNMKSCLYGLSRGPGSAITLVVGGAQESLYSKPGTAELCLLKRKGFVKVALTTGSSLVPVFGFGETDIWDQVPNPEGSMVRKIQDTLKKFITFTIPFIRGRGVFQYNWGLLPQRRPLNVVVGAPIDVPKVEKPTPEEIDEYHNKYIKGLEELYHQYKDVYAKNRQADLVFKE
uniref:Acyltransferase n=1 Tax=Arcella intermedia TaxID=1963864 RepID=A0A6B2L9Z5_9EUKA